MTVSKILSAVRPLCLKLCAKKPNRTRIAVYLTACDTHAMALHPSEFARKITACWSLESATTYSAVSPARGQCSVTALVAQDHLGGAIVKTRVGEAWHFYNLIDGERWDFTQSQFEIPLTYEDGKSNRDEAMMDTTLRQYEALSARFSRES